MATSPIYSWPEPDNTDLVKNGALAIRTLGNAIDTTMATMTPKSTYTAKGSIAAATAASTPANLSVGTNYAFLQADSTTASGLLWNNAAWTSYSVTVGAGSGSLTTANGAGYYIRIGKVCIVQLQANITTNGTAGTSISCSLPFTVGNSGFNYVGSFREMNVTGNSGVIRAGSGGTSAVFTLYNNGYPGGSGYKVEGTLVFEVA